jgi:hypothetical protein
MPGRAGGLLLRYLCRSSRRLILLERVQDMKGESEDRGMGMGMGGRDGKGLPLREPAMATTGACTDKSCQDAASSSRLVPYLHAQCVRSSRRCNTPGSSIGRVPIGMFPLGTLLLHGHTQMRAGNHHSSNRRGSGCTSRYCTRCSLARRLHR